MSINVILYKNNKKKLLFWYNRQKPKLPLINIDYWFKSNLKMANLIESMNDK